MSVQTRETEAKENAQPESQVEASDEVEQSGSNESVFQPGFGKQGSFSPALTLSNILKRQRSIGNQVI